VPAVSISCSCRRSIIIFPDPVAVARECRRILRADGYVCVRTGTRENDVVIPRFFPAVRAMLVADLNASCISLVCPLAMGEPAQRPPEWRKPAIVAPRPG